MGFLKGNEGVRVRLTASQYPLIQRIGLGLDFPTHARTSSWLGIRELLCHDRRRERYTPLFEVVAPGLFAVKGLVKHYYSFRVDRTYIDEIVFDKQDRVLGKSDANFYRLLPSHDGAFNTLTQALIHGHTNTNEEGKGRTNTTLRANTYAASPMHLCKTFTDKESETGSAIGDLNN